MEDPLRRNSISTLIDKHNVDPISKALKRLATLLAERLLPHNWIGLKADPNGRSLTPGTGLEPDGGVFLHSTTHPGTVRSLVTS